MWNVALTAEEIKKTWNKHSRNKQLLTSANPKVAAKQKQSEELAAQQNKKNIEVCTQNLVAIGKAIQAYHEEHGNYPELLSDLLSKHLTDANVLICPADKNGGKSYYPQLADPNKVVSYDYQLHTTYQKSVMETRTMFGDVTPLVRCWHHNHEKLIKP